jgi:hypothetical protein
MAAHDGDSIMVKSTAETADEYIASLPVERRGDLERVRRTVLEHLPPGYVEGMQSGMIGWFVSLDRYPDTYNGQPLLYAAFASKKNHMSLYLMGAYASASIEKALRDGFATQGKKLDLDKSCIRFKRADDLALDVIGAVVGALSVDDFIELNEASRTH